jgi:hypothetical protein
MSIDEHDRRAIRCRRLGHDVEFGYCRTQEGSTPCHSILDCWWEVFDVRAFLEKALSAEQVEELAARRPRAKVVTLLDLIEQAKRRTQGTPQGETPGEGDGGE